MTILVASRPDWGRLRQAFTTELGVSPVKAVGHVYSTLHRGMRTDFFAVPARYLDVQYDFMSFNDVGNFIGRMCRRFELTASLDHVIGFFPDAEVARRLEEERAAEARADTVAGKFGGRRVMALVPGLVGEPLGLLIRELRASLPDFDAWVLATPHEAIDRAIIEAARAPRRAPSGIGSRRRTIVRQWRMVTPGPSCPTCGRPLRWLVEVGAWGCDGCRVTYPPQAPARGGSGPAPRSWRVPLMAGIGVALIGAVVAVVAGTRGGSSGPTANVIERPHSREELARRTFAALVAGDVPALEGLADPVGQLQRTTTCPERAAEMKGEVSTRMKEDADEYRRGAGKDGKPAKVSVKSFREGPPPIKLAKGANALDGCTFTVDALIHTLTFELQVDDGRPLEARVMAMQVADDWYLIAIGYLEGLVNDSGG